MIIENYGSIVIVTLQAIVFIYELDTLGDVLFRSSDACNSNKKWDKASKR